VQFTLITEDNKKSRTKAHDDRHPLNMIESKF
jgi:hypothetical protein